MPKPAKVAVTDAEMEVALARAREYAKYDRRAIKATYSQATDRLRITLDDGAIYAVPRSLIQGLADAPVKKLNRIQIVNGGTGLLWPDLEMAHYVPAILQGVYGTEKWMASLARQKRKLQVVGTGSKLPRNGKNRPER